LVEKNPFITLGDEFDEHCQLDYTVLLKMVSGEQIAAAKKHGDPHFLNWPTHLLLSGNEVPAWKDKEGNLTRRVVNMIFEKKVRSKDKDPMLMHKLEKEIPITILKCARAYLEMIAEHQGEDFWNFCPTYFRETKTKLALTTNILRRYIEEGGFQYGSTLSIPERVFYYEFKQFAKSNGELERSNIKNKDITYKNILQDINEERELGLKYETKTITYQGVIYTNANVFTGLDLSSNVEQNGGFGTP